MPHPYTHISSRCFINVPFRRLQQDLQRVIGNRIQPEIGLDGSILDCTEKHCFQHVAEALRAAELACTLHAPFLGISPGDPNRAVLMASRDTLRKAFALIRIFEPVSIVCHLDYRAEHGRDRLQWQRNSLATWQEMLAVAGSCRTRLMLENTFETTPEMHRFMLEALASPQVGFCLDVGHVMAFARNTWQDWLPALQPWLGQLHLHDNQGDNDDHLAIGRGRFDFHGLFSFLQDKHLEPVVTLEPHSEPDLWISLAALDTMNYFPRQ